MRELAESQIGKPSEMSTERVDELVRKCRPAGFLFNKEIADYVTDVSGVAAVFVHRPYGSLDDSQLILIETTGTEKTAGECFAWLQEQVLLHKIDIVFEPFLRQSH